MIYNNDCIVLDLSSYFYLLFNIVKIKKIKNYYFINKIYPQNFLTKILRLNNSFKIFLIKIINKNITYCNIASKKEYFYNWKSNLISIKFTKLYHKKNNKLYFFKSLNTYLKSDDLLSYYMHRNSNLISAIIYKRLILRVFFKFNNKKRNKLNLISNIILNILLSIIYIFLPLFFFIKNFSNLRINSYKNNTIIFHPLIKSLNYSKIKLNDDYIKDEFNFFSKNIDNKKFLFFKNNIWQANSPINENIIDKKNFKLPISLLFKLVFKHLISIYYLFLGILFNNKFNLLFFNILALNEIYEKYIELKNVTYKYEIIRDDYRSNHIIRHIINKKNNISSLIIQHHIFPIEYPSIVFSKANNIFTISKFHENQYKKYLSNIVPICRINNYHRVDTDKVFNGFIIYLPSFRKTSGEIDQFRNFINSFEAYLKTGRLSNFEIYFKVKNIYEFEKNIEDNYRIFYEKIQKFTKNNKNISFLDSNSVDNESLFKTCSIHLVFGPSFVIWELESYNRKVYVYPIKGFENDFFKDYSNIVLINSFEYFIKKLEINFDNNEISETYQLNYDKKTKNFKEFFKKITNE